MMIDSLDRWIMPIEWVKTLFYSVDIILLGRKVKALTVSHVYDWDVPICKFSNNLRMGENSC